MSNKKDKFFTICSGSPKKHITNLDNSQPVCGRKLRYARKGYEIKTPLSESIEEIESFMSSVNDTNALFIIAQIIDALKFRLHKEREMVICCHKCYECAETPKADNQKLFDYLHNELDVLALQSQMHDIIQIVMEDNNFWTRIESD